LCGIDLKSGVENYNGRIQASFVKKP
jgi:hypothetical protein